MKNNIITIIRKEFSRFFKDKRMVITTLILPGLMIYVMYSVMGTALTSFMSTDESYEYKVVAYNLPESIEAMTEEMNLKVTDITENQIDENKEAIKEQEVDALIVFPKAFEEKIQTGEVTDVEIFYNSISTASGEAYGILSEVLNQYESFLSNIFDVNNADKQYDLVTEEEMTGEIFSMMLPLLLLIFIFSGCMAIAPESIAGEKERGTIATLLVTPLKRGELAIGKIISLSVIGLLCGISSFLGTILSLPKIMGAAAESMSVSVYKPLDFLLLLVVVLVTTLILISLLSVISAMAKSVKEATTVVVPIMILVMLIGITSMFGDGAQTAFYWYLIPVYNCVQSMSGILSFSYLPINILVTVISNLVYVVLLTVVLTKIFNSEKIMFSK